MFGYNPSRKEVTEMTLGELIKQYRQKMGLSQREFSARCGVSNMAISMYEKSGINPKTGKPYKIEFITYYKIATAMGMDIDEMFELLGDDAIVGMVPPSIKKIKPEDMKQVPLIGKVAAGEPIPAEETHEAYIPAPSKADYALEIAGESMLPTYLPGDIVYIRAQPDIDYPGQVAVVLLDDEATVKHVYKQEDGLLLISDNPSYAPMHKLYSDYSTIRILGKVCGFTRMYK